MCANILHGLPIADDYGRFFATGTSYYVTADAHGQSKAIRLSRRARCQRCAGSPLLRRRPLPCRRAGEGAGGGALPPNGWHAGGDRSVTRSLNSGVDKGGGYRGIAPLLRLWVPAGNAALGSQGHKVVFSGPSMSKSDYKSTYKTKCLLNKSWQINSQN